MKGMFWSQIMISEMGNYFYKRFNDGQGLDPNMEGIEI